MFLSSKTDGWPWNHLEEVGSSGSVVVTGKNISKIA